VVLIIPALVILNKPMKEAVGTSLVIIAAKSLIGFFGEAGEIRLTGNSCLAFQHLL
jgi:uncharacterized membrane protein YfcA